MATYHLEYGSGVLKTLSRLPRGVQDRIVTRLGLLSSHPRPAGCIKLEGEEAYRIRVGDYRVIYAIDDGKLIVLVIDIGHRSDVYRRR